MKRLGFYRQESFRQESYRPKSVFSVVLAMTFASVAGLCCAEEAVSLKNALSEGDVDLHFRYRYEYVDDARPEQAGASTLKSRLTYTSKRYSGLQAGVEVDDVTVIGGENYDDFHNDNTSRSVVADPEGTEFNQAWLAYSGLDNTVVKYGRQRINLDNQRFIGGVGWRQNEQTYDGLTIVNKSLPDTTLVYAYVDNINRIFGPDNGRAGTPAIADLGSNANILNLNYKGLALGELSGYAYLLDVDDAPAISSKTFGVRFSGSHGKNSKILYTAEYAVQSDYGDNPQRYDADYYTLEAGLQVKKITAKVGLEVLEADSSAGVAFVTPLATLHKFQGFADKFLNTPAGGVEDIYASLFASVLGTKLGVIYHSFTADAGGADYGDEVDLVVAKSVNEHIDVLLKYANYNAKDFSADTEKLWLQVSLTF